MFNIILCLVCFYFCNSYRKRSCPLHWQCFTLSGSPSLFRKKLTDPQSGQPVPFSSLVVCQVLDSVLVLVKLPRSNLSQSFSRLPTQLDSNLLDTSYWNVLNCYNPEKDIHSRQVYETLYEVDAPVYSCFRGDHGFPDGRPTSFMEVSA